MKNKEYKELEINGKSEEGIKLGCKPLDFNKCYDIKSPEGEEFLGCKVSLRFSYHQGLKRRFDDGWESRTCKNATPYFKLGDFENKLKSGFLMRMNKKVTAQKNLPILYKKREKLDREISDLESVI